MNERFITLESGIDYGVKDTMTGDCVFDVDITELLNALHEENQLLKQRLIEQNDVEWLRNNTVWEQMPTNIKTIITTSNDTRNKVELEDIIGLVKTDEPTNSVELKKELYNDTKKQFKFDNDAVAINLKTPIIYDGKRMSIGEVLDKLNELHEEREYWKQSFNEVLKDLEVRTFDKELLEKENERLKKRVSKLQSKYDKNKTDELHILVETDNTVLLDKEEFKAYARRNNELKKRNKRRKEKNRKYRNELRKRLKEISGLKEFITEDLSKEDKVLKGFIEEYL